MSSIVVVRLEACTGIGLTGIPRNPRRWKLMLRGSSGDGKNVAGLPRGWNKVVRDFRGNVALFDFCSAPAATKNCFQTVERCLH